MALKKPTVTSTEAVEETLTAEGVQATTTQEVEVEETTETSATNLAANEEAKVEEPAENAESVSETTAVATQEPAKAPAAAEVHRNAMANFSAQMAEQGFEGLELTGMSFDRIKLHEGQFKLGQEEIELGSEFDCIIHSVRKLFVVRQSTDNDAESFYSYDPKGSTFTDGGSAREKLEEWLEDGYGTEDAPLDIREYGEATATLVNRDDEFDDQMVMLSIPPASRARLSGAAAQAFQKFKGALLSDVVVRCMVGRKAGEGQKSFRPWVFKVVGRV